MVIRGFTDEDTGEVHNLSDAAFILDGQHRLAGLKTYNKEKPFEVNVSIFIGLDKSDQAEIFSKVNLTQTRVNKSLVYDLYTYQEKPSPTKTAHKLSIALDQDEGGPLSGRIKRLGITSPGRDAERLSQATVVRGILKHGFNALIRFLKPCFIKLCNDKPRIVSQQEFYEIFKTVDLAESQLLIADTEYGGSGESWLYKKLMSLSKL